MSSEFQCVDRPTGPALHRDRSALHLALEATFKNGGAIAMPIPSGDSYSITRYRKCGAFMKTAKRMNASLRCRHSADGLSVLLWLEAKVSNS